MFQAGEYIVYGNSGVCEVKSVGLPDIPLPMDSKPYYTLSPLYSTEIIYTPVDTKQFMRRVITREEAEQLLADIPDVEEMEQGFNAKWLENMYEASLQKNNCRILVKIIKSIYIKHCDAIVNKKKISDTDHKYLKRAEDLLYSELSVVLGMSVDEVKQHVDGVLEQLVVEK